MNWFPKKLLKYKMVTFVIAVVIGCFFGQHANTATYKYLEESYYFNETVNGIIGLVVNIGLIFLPCYIWAKYSINARKKIEEEFEQKSK